MEPAIHKYSELFAQLGLDSTPAAIDKFIAEHKLDKQTKLEEAPFWTSSQAEFLRQALDADSDWAELVDELNAELRC